MDLKERHPEGKVAPNGSGVEATPLSRKVTDETGQHITDYVDLKQLPEFCRLGEQVSKIVDSSSWFENYGIDAAICASAMFGWFMSHHLLASSNPLTFVFGIFVLGYCHGILTVKGGHCAIHGALCQTQKLSMLFGFLFSDFIGQFSTDVGYAIHIKCHHPHTNIISLGDSSTWKAPFVPNLLYMFVTPLMLPILTPLVSLESIMSESLWKIIRYLIIGGLGLTCHIYLLTTISQLSISWALLVIFLSRNLLAIPYIHVNIFQHIGLPMYSKEHRPKRIYQMATGVLNLPRNLFLDFPFGHGIVSCHIEHHLFPRLSDNMCLKVQPLVREFFRQHNLSYNEDTYMGRTNYFLTHYKELMVDAPPMTSFIGLQ